MLEPAARIESEGVAFLATVPLFDGIPPADLAELAGLLQRRDLAPGDVLWREGEPARGMALIVEGRVSLSLHLPGERLIEFPGLGPGEVLGEVPLFDGGCHSATVRAVGPVRLLWLSRAEFAALLARRHSTSFALKRRIASVACTRLRVRLEAIAASLGGDGAPPPPVSDPGGLEPCAPPSSAYVCRLAAFRALDSLARGGVVAAGRFALCPAGRTLVAEGAPSTACYVTMNGAVEQVIVRGGRRTRIGLAGPGQAFGYESLIDGFAAPMTAITRERTLLLIIPGEAFAQLFHGDTVDSHAFLDVIDRELMAALRQVQRPHARLAAMPV